MCWIAPLRANSARLSSPDKVVPSIARVRPSEMLKIEDGWIAYQIDLAAAVAGSEKKRPGAPPAGGYRQPTAMKRMKVPENGVW